MKEMESSGGYAALFLASYPGSHVITVFSFSQRVKGPGYEATLFPEIFKLAWITSSNNYC